MVISSIIAVASLVFLAAICSGLNIALMSLSLAELERKVRLGDKKAKRVLPFRKNAHLSLASILLVNVAAASATPLVLNSHINGFFAAAISTLLLVVFSELAPQAFFTRHALAVCSFFSPLLRLMVLVTFPLAKPLQIALDRIFGTQANDQLHTRRELGLLIREHHGSSESELDEDELEIIKGALDLSETRVGEIMTDIRDVYWLLPDTIIDDKKIDEIKATGHNRMPVFNKKLTKFYGVLLMRDLVDIDFDERSYSVNEFKLHPAKLVGSMTALDTMFRHFINARSHLIAVEKKDKIVGIVTIEDLFEKIIGHDIIDESDLPAQP